MDHFARIRREKFCFHPWKQFFFKMLKVKQMNQRIVAKFTECNFSGWKKATRKLRELRIQSIQNWKEYPKLLCEKPFKAWAKFVIATKNFASEQARIVHAYIRWKGRQKLSLIIRTWRHQAIYGRIDGMYTRRMLINSLTEQKLLSTGLEKMLSSQTLELESCKLLLETEVANRFRLEEQLTVLENDITKHRMIEHHLEQETIRLESVIDVSLQYSVILQPVRPTRKLICTTTVALLLCTGHGGDQPTPSGPLAQHADRLQVQAPQGEPTRPRGGLRVAVPYH